MRRVRDRKETGSAEISVILRAEVIYLARVWTLQVRCWELTLVLMIISLIIMRVVYLTRLSHQDNTRK